MAVTWLMKKLGDKVGTWQESHFVNQHFAANMNLSVTMLTSIPFLQWSFGHEIVGSTGVSSNTN